MYTYKKKALASSTLIIIILLVVFLLVVIPFIMGYLETSRHQSSVIECTQLFTQIDGKPAYFENSLDAPTPLLSKAIATSCPSKDFEVEKNYIKPAADLIEECYKKTGKGEDIFGSSVDGSCIVLYCGRINSDETIDDFNEKLSSQLSKRDYEYLFKDDKETINVNEAFLDVDSLPQKIDEDNSAQVFYYIYRPNMKNYVNIIKTQISKFIGSSSKIGSMINFWTADNVLETFSGVLVSDRVNYDADSKSVDEIDFPQDMMPCEVIVPLKNLD